MGFDLFMDILGDDFYKNKPIIEQIKNIISFIEDINSKYTIEQLNINTHKRLLENKTLKRQYKKETHILYQITLILLYQKSH